MSDSTALKPERLASGPRATKPESALWRDGLKQGVLIGAAIVAVMLPPGRASLLSGPVALEVVLSTGERAGREADFGAEEASPDARSIANWSVRSVDHQQLYFVILDKINTKVFVFNSSGKLVGASAVLIGAAKGDDSVTGIGGRPMAEVQEHERTTPAGRFLGEPGRNAHGEDVVWVDYTAAVSMHRVRAIEPKERRLERLASPTTEDNRISYGCINMPVDFFETVLKPAFDGRYGVIYVLPEVKSASEVFRAAFGSGHQTGVVPASQANVPSVVVGL